MGSVGPRDHDDPCHDHACGAQGLHRVGHGARCELDRAREVRAVAVYGVTSTPFQKATYPSMFFASSLAVG